ncbi:bifunctional DNA primase/polymerase [Burkholderia sp. Bp8990]|uniref:bifunctional DNA primase/polymerase n=1 Tax=Burkholderia sp. Bp8990 TaxID=2184552 RepID=UPI000F5A3031|nr:bifunctional DNA primase/polymerase [Burkholderia sp. Bp8990]RQS39737.1 DUF3987 domain-containing protein [Burkholderia sp. Bp8990]
MSETKSPFARRAYFYIEQGYSVIPIAPGTKRPGAWSAADGWKGMFDWERFGDRTPSEIELSHWEKWPDAGLGLVCGKLSNIVAIDRDYDAPGTDALELIIPYSPVKKKGAKGYTAFFRHNGEKSMSWNLNGVRVLDLLSDGRQTLMPGTVHPDGHTYIYLTEDCLEDFRPGDLPALPDDFCDQVSAVLEPYQTHEDRKYQRTPRKHEDKPDAISTELSVTGQYFRDLNKAALQQLEAWVPKLITSARPERDGFRCIASWRGCEKANVGIHPAGIFDFGGNYGMTPIDLVMYAHGLTFSKAAEQLRACVMLDEIEPMVLTVGGHKLSTGEVADSDTGEIVQPKTASSPTPVWLTPRAPSPAPVYIAPNSSAAPAPAIPTHIMHPPGMLGRIAEWINATAPKRQPELAVAAAITLGATVMQRRYRSNFANFTSLYVVMVAKSTEGKEHPQAAVERVLTAANLSNLVAGSGYTSSGAVYSELLRKPSHLAIIDEMGKLLKLSRAKGNSNAEAAIDKLVEAFGKLAGVMRPPVYSSMTVPKGMQDTGDRVIHNPAISLLGATTPATFYDALTDDLVRDGFLGRLLVVESSQPRQLARLVDQTEPPSDIVEWCTNTADEIRKKGDVADVASADTPANTLPFPFEEACHYLLKPFEEELNDLKTQHEPDGLDVLLGRTFEKSLRLAMIAAKATHPADNVVRVADLEWAIKYVRHYDLALLESVRTKRTRGETDAQIQRMIRYVESAAKYTGDKRFGKILRKGGMPHAKLLKLMAIDGKSMRLLVDTALETGVIGRTPGTPDGYAGDVYWMASTAE